MFLQAARSVRHFSDTLVRHRYFQTTVILLILLNALLVALESYSDVFAAYAPLLVTAEQLLLGLFTLELLLRIASQRSLLVFLKDGWNVFDLLIVFSSYLFIGGPFITVLRILRILRVMRVISVIPSLRKIVNALLMTIPAIGNISLLLALLFFVFGVMGTSLFGTISPEYFGSLHESVLTLFQIILLDSVMGIVRPLLEVAPWAWIYFVAFILFGCFVIFNLFVGVIVTNIEKADSTDSTDEPSAPASPAANDSPAPTPTVQEQLVLLRQELAELKSMLRQDRDR